MADAPVEPTFAERGLDLSLRHYLAEVAAPTPTATGGAVCAITTASAAGLVAMTARLSTFDGADRLAADAELLRSRAQALATEDGAAYAAVLAARREGAAALRAAYARAAEPPLAIASTAAETAGLAELLARRGKRAVRGDAAVAASLAAAVARSAAALARLDLAAAGEPTAADDAERAAAAAARAADAALAALA